MSRVARKTIKEFACKMFVRVNYIDIDGRNVGYDYDYILAEVKKQFPNASTSKRWLRKMAYDLNGTVRMPVRRRSRYALARGYAMVLLLKAENGVGLSYHSIWHRVHRKFPDHTPGSSVLRSLEVQLRHREFVIPPRPEEV